MLTPLLAIAPFLAPLATQVLVVDDDGGPGVDFTSIAAAVAAAAPGDVLLVEAGEYASFVVDKPLTVIGSGPGTHVSGLIEIAGIPAGDAVALVAVHPDELAIRDCAGAVVVQEITGTTTTALPRWLDVSACADVRVRDAVFGPLDPQIDVPGTGIDGVHVRASRVELVESTLRGANASTSSFVGDAAHVEDSRAHLVLVDADGGHGAMEWFWNPGPGGAGVRIDGTSNVVLDRCRLSGGPGGWIWTSPMQCDLDQAPGPGVFNQGRTVAQGCVVPLIPYLFGVHCAPLLGGDWIGAPPIDDAPRVPRLLAVGAPTAGASLELRVSGQPGALVRLDVSVELTVVPSPGSLVPRLVGAATTVELGTIPGSGPLVSKFTLPAEWDLGTIAALQAEVQGAGALQRSNSVPIVVR